MPRLKRVIKPGSVVHIVSRFFRRDYILREPGFRAEYARRLGDRITGTSWRIISYALMDSHIHLGAVAGEESFGEVFHPVNSGFSGWVSRQTGLVGHVFAGRPSTWVIAPELAARLVAYHHNNPVRAGVVPRARDSTWTSHRAYLNPGMRPAWLNVELGLSMAGFSDTPADRAAFDAIVEASMDDELSVLHVDARKVRADLGSAIELTYPELGADGRPSASLLTSSDATVRIWRGELRDILDLVAIRLGIDAAALTSSSRQRAIVQGRRLCVVVASRLGRNRSDIARVLAISRQAASQLERSATVEERAIAGQLYETLLSPSLA